MSQGAEDIRYSELLFLLSFPDGGSVARTVSAANDAEAAAFRLIPILYADMVMTLLEEMYIRFQNDADQQMVSNLRGEVQPPADRVAQSPAQDFRSILHNFLVTGPAQCELRITYRGLRRVEELREVLTRERVLEDFGVLLSIRYLNADLEHALRRSDGAPLSVIRIDMDGFKAVNERFGHLAGDVVMKAYLTAVRDAVGPLGDAYRGSGDEVVVTLVGHGHEHAISIAERIRTSVAALRCEYDGQALPIVTASVGVASSPPEERTRALHDLADQRQSSAKERGKNQVVAA